MNSAVKAKVPVVVFDSGAKTEQIVSYVATDNFKGGQLGGKGKVILLRYMVGSTSTEEREAGILDAMKKSPGIQIISSDQHSGSTRESAYAKAQNILNRFGKKVDGIFCPCEPVTTAVTKAICEIGRAGGQVKIIGFDAGTQSVTDLAKGAVQGLVRQNTASSAKESSDTHHELDLPRAHGNRRVFFLHRSRHCIAAPPFMSSKSARDLS